MPFEMGGIGLGMITVMSVNSLLYDNGSPRSLVTPDALCFFSIPRVVLESMYLPLAFSQVGLEKPGESGIMRRDKRATAH